MKELVQRDTSAQIISHFFVRCGVWKVTLIHFPRDGAWPSSNAPRASPRIQPEPPKPRRGRRENRTDPCPDNRYSVSAIPHRLRATDEPREAPDRRAKPAWETQPAPHRETNATCRPKEVPPSVSQASLAHNADHRSSSNRIQNIKTVSHGVWTKGQGLRLFYDVGYAQQKHSSPLGRIKALLIFKTNKLFAVLKSCAYPSKMVSKPNSTKKSRRCPIFYWRKAGKWHLAKKLRPHRSKHDLIRCLGV